MGEYVRYVHMFFEDLRAIYAHVAMYLKAAGVRTIHAHVAMCLNAAGGREARG